MVQLHESKIVPLIGIPSGLLKNFTTPTAFVAGTFRAVWNGQVYEPDDGRYGWVEISDNQVEFTQAPMTDDVMSCFYQELSTVPGIGNVKGSPFHPTGSFP